MVRSRKSIAVQTTFTPSKEEISAEKKRARLLRKAAKLREKRAATKAAATLSALADASDVQSCVSHVLPTDDQAAVLHVERTTILGSVLFAPIVRRVVGNRWIVQSWWPSVTSLSALPSAESRTRTRSDGADAPARSVPQYDIPLADHPWSSQSVFTEQIWSGCTGCPIGHYVAVEPHANSVRCYTFKFPGTSLVVEIAHIPLSRMDVLKVGELHKSVAKALVGRKQSGVVAVRDTTATEEKYLAAGYSSLENGVQGRPYVHGRQAAASESAKDASFEHVRLPYVRKGTKEMESVVQECAPFLAKAAVAFGDVASDESSVSAEFQYPPRSWQCSTGPHMKGHQLALKLRGLPIDDSLSASDLATLPSSTGNDFAVMHRDAFDDGVGSLVYINHAHSDVESKHAHMPHGDLIVTSGPDGGPMVRIQTYSPDHLVAVRFDASQCAHCNLQPVSHERSFGVTQLRLLHYSRTEIRRVCEYFTLHPNPSMETLHFDWLRKQRQLL